MRNRRRSHARLLVAAAAVLVASSASALSQFPDAAIHVILSGGGVSPAVVTPASGECAGRLTPSTGKLVLGCTNDVAGAGNTFVSLGVPGAGANQFTLGSGGVAGGEVTLSETQVALLLGGGLHVGVASGSHPGGEIGGRLLAASAMGEQTMRFPLVNDEMVNTGSAADGLCTLRITKGNGSAHIACVHDVASPAQFRVMIDGGTVASTNDVASPFEVSVPAIAGNVDRLVDGDFGVVLTSAGFPTGELGKVLVNCVEGPNRLCLNRERFAVTVTFSAPGWGSGSGHAVAAKASDSGLFWFFAATNWEIQLKILDGCAVNDHYWVYMSANTNVQFTLRIYDTLTGAVKTYSNAQGHTASPVEDTRALACG